MEENKLTINYFWIGSTLSKVELLCLNAAYNNGLRPILWSFDKIQNIPSFVEQKDANEVMQRIEFENLLNNLRLPLASISDIFRYKLLNKIGGIYSDLDIAFIKKPNFPNTEFVCSSFEYLYGECANNCFMQIHKGSKLSKDLLTEAYARLDLFEKEKSPYCLFGPFLVQKIIKSKQQILPYDVINPINWRWTSKIIVYKQIDWKFRLKTFARKLINKEYLGYSVTKKTVAIHLNNEIWKKNNLEKDDNFNVNCLFEKLKKQYAI